MSSSKIERFSERFLIIPHFYSVDLRKSGKKNDILKELKLTLLVSISEIPYAINHALWQL